MAKSALKKAIGKIHLWLGLSSGLVVFIVSITGCIYVFEEEINLVLKSGVRKQIEIQARELIPADSLLQIALSIHGDDIQRSNITVFPDGNRAAIVWVRDSSSKYVAYVLNPYDGSLIERYAHSISFWAIIIGLHTSLLIPEVGHHIVSISTIIFLIMVITGIILWFPASKNGYKQRFSIRWNASAKRITYDLHNVIGFYISWAVIFIALTGLVISYSWVKDGIIYLTDKAFAPFENTEIMLNPLAEQQALEQQAWNATFRSLSASYTDLNEIYLMAPSPKSENYTAVFRMKQGRVFNKNDRYEISPQSGKIESIKLWNNNKASEKLMDANYNIHVGAILGVPGKILAFFASLFAASLPVTGFLIWRNRKKNAKRLQKR